MSILPDYIIKKKLICIGEFFEKKNKKKNARKGIIFKEFDEDIYYILENINDSIENIKKNDFFIEYIYDGIDKTIIANNYCNVNLVDNNEKGYLYNKKNKDHLLRYYSDSFSYIDYFIYFLN